MKHLQNLATVLGFGALGGAAVFALDYLMAMAMQAQPTLSWGIAPPYLLAGIAAAAVAAAVRLSRRGKAASLLAWTIALLCTLPLVERLGYVLDARIGTLAAFAIATVVGLVVYAVWIGILRWVLGDVRFAWDAALVLAAATVVAGLTLNRNLSSLPLEPIALMADAAVVIGVLTIAGLIRGAGWQRAGLAAGGFAVAALVFVNVPWHRSSEDARGDASHLLFLVIDTLRQDVFQNVVDTTAEGQAFKEALGDAVWFNNAIAAAPWTAPSMGSVMTGLYPSEHGFGGFEAGDTNRPLRRLSASVTTLAERLKKRGYRNEAIVANTILHPVTGIGRGFDHYELLEGAATLPLLTVLKRFGWKETYPYQPARTLRRRFEQRLDILASGDPFFLWLHFMDPHDPLHAHRLPPDPKAPELDESRRLYRDETRYALAEVAKVLEKLQDRGLWENTVLVLVSDHGEMFNSDGRNKAEGHGQAFYEELVRIPLVIRPAGGGTQERTVNAVVSHMDLHGTIADLLGIRFPALGEDRVSLKPWLGPEPPSGPVPSREFALSTANRKGPPQRSLRTYDMKLIQDLSGGSPDELYDLGLDPGERKNLTLTEDERLAALQERIEKEFSLLGVAPADSLPVEMDAATRERLKALGYIQ